MREITFKDIQNFFGDRGIIIKAGHLLRWGIDNKYVYWIPNNKKCDAYLARETDTQDLMEYTLFTSRRSLCIEIEDEVRTDSLPTTIWR